MKTYLNFILSLTVLFILTFLVDSAFANLDPGTNNMVQWSIAIIAAVSLSILLFVSILTTGMYWGRLRSFFSQIFGRKFIK